MNLLSAGKYFPRNRAAGRAPSNCMGSSVSGPPEFTMPHFKLLDHLLFSSQFVDFDPALERQMLAVTVLCQAE